MFAGCPNHLNLLTVILFTLLCLSHGARMRFVGMLNHIGLTVSWKKAMEVLDDIINKMKGKHKETDTY